jgi:hypothetical protein
MDQLLFASQTYPAIEFLEFRMQVAARVGPALVGACICTCANSGRLAGAFAARVRLRAGAQKAKKSGARSGEKTWNFRRSCLVPCNGFRAGALTNAWSVFVVC